MNNGLVERAVVAPVVGAVGPWALGVLICLLGVMGLGLLVISGWDEEKDSSSWRSQLWEGGVFICGLMVAGPLLMLLPEDVRRALADDETTYLAPFDGALAVLAFVFGFGIWLVMRLGLPPLRRRLREKPVQPRRGRPSPPRKGKRSKKRRNK